MEDRVKCNHCSKIIIVRDDKPFKCPKCGTQYWTEIPKKTDDPDFDWVADLEKKLEAGEQTDDTDTSLIAEIKEDLKEIWKNIRDAVSSMGWSGDGEGLVAKLLVFLWETIWTIFGVFLLLSSIGYWLFLYPIKWMWEFQKAPNTKTQKLIATIFKGIFALIALVILFWILFSLSGY